MKQQLLCMQTWRPVNLLCSARHAGSEVTFLCACPTDCSGGGGGTFRIVRRKEGSQRAGRRRFLTSEASSLVSPGRETAAEAR